jgi:hypothetical protein
MELMSLLLRTGRMMTCPHDGLSGWIRPDRRQTSETSKSRARIEACASSRPPIIPNARLMQAQGVVGLNILGRTASYQAVKSPAFTDEQ